MIRSIIIDDEQHCIRALLNDLQQNCPSVDVLDTCHSAKEGMLSIKKNKPDLIFLDVEMPWMNGFEMLELLGDINSSIIFTTAHDEFAAKAFRISAVDYLLKPVDANDLKAAVQKVERKMQEGGSLEHIANLLRNIKQPSQDQKIALPQREGYEFVEVSSILYCLAEGAYTKVVLDNKRSMLISRALGDVEELLPQDIFQRIHHSSLVNVSYISQFLRTDGGYVVLGNGEKLAVSKSKKDSLMERLGLK
ncbi:MAG TPA: LytTR family DNA-binding domain-containing protein [Chitinophagaceae bacterium]|nr:LytTR family DNA-binding domain-containing protein [Chitinophagaceae bacterium]